MDRLARENTALKEEIAKKDALLANDPGAVGKRERELKAARTRIGSVSLGNTILRQARDEALAEQRRVTKVAKDCYRKLRAIPHPDGETNRERNAVKTELAAKINATIDAALRELDRDVNRARRR